MSCSRRFASSRARSFYDVWKATRGSIIWNNCKVKMMRSIGLCVGCATSRIHAAIEKFQTEARLVATKMIRQSEAEFKAIRVPVAGSSSAKRFKTEEG